MPPKGAPRGRGGALGARGGRGGAAVGQSSNSESAPPETSGTEAAQSTEPAAVPINEDVGDSSVSETVESAGAGSLSSSQAVAESAARPPRQRLDSLKSAEPSSRSASPAVRRGTSSRGKKPIALPSFSGRRSKEERDARTAEAAAREKERNKFRDREAERKQREREKALERARRSAAMGRGGYSGAVSGPFSMASSRDKKVNHRNFGSGGGAGSRATRIKDENDGSGGSSNRSGGGNSYFKREGGDNGGEESSEDDQDAEFPRKDIDLIEISDDDNDDGAPVRTQLPVRIGRKEHKERVVGINTDASTEMSAKLLKEAEGAGGSPNGQEGSSSKGKGKAKDVEITGEGRPFKGMWQDPEDGETKVKPEPTSDSEEMSVDAEQVGIGAKTEDTQGVERKFKIKEKEPALQTDEERAEWARFQANLRHVREELGPDNESMQDGSGDVNMVDAAVADKPNRRDNHVYLFQLPPIIPELLEFKSKKEQSDHHPKPVELAAPKSLASNAGPAGATAAGPQIKQEEGEFSSTLPKAPEAPKFASGRVGKLKVHQSGRTTLDWGGVDYELTPGNHVSFLQEVVSLRIEDEKNRVAEEMAGDAVSLGRIKGKFVVTPDFSTIFSKDK